MRKALFAIVLLALNVAAGAQEQAPRAALRVCQDPNNLPFSNLGGEGLENRLAELFGKALGLPVTYYSFPQRMAFIRNTLRYKLPGQDYPCDIVMGVPLGFDQVSVTKPYYRSTYALVFAEGRGLDAVRSGPEFLARPRAQLSQLRIGIFDKSPASVWLSRHGLVDSGVPYLTLNADPQQYPGQMIENDLVAGKLDAAIVWGPVAGFFAKRVSTLKLRVVPLRSEPGIRFDYEMGAGVRHGEPQWKAQVETIIESRRSEIAAILADFGVPVDDASYSVPPGTKP